MTRKQQSCNGRAVIVIVSMTTFWARPEKRRAWIRSRALEKGAAEAEAEVVRMKNQALREEARRKRKSNEPREDEEEEGGDDEAEEETRKKRRKMDSGDGMIEEMRKRRVDVWKSLWV